MKIKITVNGLINASDAIKHFWGDLMYKAFMGNS